jgi:hypothetical protein
VAVEGKIEHIGGITDPSARDRLFLEWFAFARVDDAVITSHSSFGYTAYARSLRIPVSGAHLSLCHFNSSQCGAAQCGAVQCGAAQSRDCQSNLDAAHSRAATVGAAGKQVTVDPREDPHLAGDKFNRCERKPWNQSGKF